MLLTLQILSCLTLQVLPHALLKELGEPGGGVLPKAKHKPVRNAWELAYTRIHYMGIRVQACEVNCEGC